MSESSKPTGLIVIGILLLLFAAVVFLISLALALGNPLVFDGEQPTWLLIICGIVGLTIAYFVGRVALSLLANRATRREVVVKTLWWSIPASVLALLGANLIITEGAADVAVYPLLGTVGLLWMGLAVTAILYLRSPGVRSYYGDAQGPP
ncbi:MAG TPA: hypothetical protein VI141_04280 [Acidimicrobiia bacterium]